MLRLHIHIHAPFIPPVRILHSSCISDFSFLEIFHHFSDCSSLIYGRALVFAEQESLSPGANFSCLTTCKLYRMSMKAKELIKLLRENGWKLERIRGSHHIFFRNGKTVSVPVHGNRDIPTGTLSIILKQADLK